jgi:hypothetical protein
MMEPGACRPAPRSQVGALPERRSTSWRRRPGPGRTPRTAPPSDHTRGTFFTLAALATRDFARDHGLRALAIAGIATPFFAAAAALFNAAENIVWLLVLGGHGGSLGPPFATACASLKFLLIGLAIVYVLWGLISRMRLR